ncbi:BTB/POZ domain-containing protein 2 [Amphibalanus amphitrite]|uniref:BTB/POZ domain-containing protein 2 n=1 Tax=Amphibalanus amphitrite TaxID=1232801 RepID=A0A6A4VDZ3_AMPAM|nr:BTB/POZ domain-containing protein 2 [Amphibalanus amphitrite]
MPDATELDNAAPRGAPPATVSNGPPAETAQRPLASFRLPPYTPEEPDLWLLQVECAFDISGVSSDELRYKLLVANLPATIAVQVKDVIRTSRSFTALCDALKSRLAQSRADRLQSLLSRQQLGDQKPTALLRSMRNELAAAGDAPVDTELFRTLFKQRLPQPVRAALALLPADSALDALAEAADRYLDASGPDPRVAVSVLPRRCLPKKSTLTPAPAGQQLVAANGSPIAVYGTCLLDVTLSRHHSLKHRFFVTDVTTPILGTDFLAAHQLVVDVASQRLLRDGTVCASAQRSRLAVFQNTLYGGQPPERPVVVRDWDPGTFKLMIEFIYSGECIIASVEKARDIFHIGRAYQCADLVRYISQFVADAVRSYRFTPLTCGNLFFFLEFSREVADAELTQLCWGYVDQYAARIIGTPDFSGLSKDMVATILDRETFDVGDELVVFLAVKRWGEQQLRAAGQRAQHETLRQTCADLLPFVHMDRIDESDFVKTVLPSGLVGPQELISFFMVRGIEIPRNIDLGDNQSACRMLMEPHRRRPPPHERCLRYRAGYKLARDDMEALHELRFRADKDLQLVGLHLGYIFSQMELGLTVRVQGPFERVQWTDAFSQYHRVSGDCVGAAPADMRVLFHQPVAVEGGCCYKVTVKVDRWKYIQSDFNIWGGQSGPSRVRTDDGRHFYFLQAAIEKGRDIRFADMKQCRGLITELLYKPV